MTVRSKVTFGPEAQIASDKQTRRKSATFDPGRSKPVKAKPVKAKGAKPDRADAKPVHAKPVHSKPVRSKPVGPKPARPKSASPKSAGPKSANSKPLNSKRAGKFPGRTKRPPGGRKPTKSAAPGSRATQIRKLARRAASKKIVQASDPAVAKLQARVRKLMGQLAEAQRRIGELESWAETDFLLDILNRRGFERELHRAIAYIKRYHVTGVLIILDVDHLKPVNDTFGHAAGDAVLKGIVNVILRHVRSSDVVGRLGGDEFAVLLWNLDEADACAKVAALENAIDHLVFVFHGRSMSSGASAGMTIITPGDDAMSALERADLAMYERKKNRRNRLPPHADIRQ